MAPTKSPSPRARSLTSVVAESAVTGALTLIDLTAFSLQTRRAIGAGAAGVVGPISAIAAHRGGTNAGTTIGVATAAAAATYGSVALSFWADRSIHFALERRGVRRPRVVMAVAAAALAFALAEATRRMEHIRTEAGYIESTELSLPPQEAP